MNIYLRSPFSRSIVISSLALWLFILLRRHHMYALRFASSGNCRRAMSMDHRARFSTLSAGYDDFLFAPVCEDTNGIPLSVLSALARMNVDPWEEASRLATMPKIIAEKTLLSALARASGRSWNSPEAAAIVARLVRLLPCAGEADSSRRPAAANPTAAAANDRRGQTRYSWVLLALSLAISFMLLRQEGNTTIGRHVWRKNIDGDRLFDFQFRAQVALSASSAE